MATTTNRHYRYPAGGDSPAGMTQIEQLAEDIDADVTERTVPGGWTAVTVASGTTVVGAAVSRTGDDVKVRGQISKAWAASTAYTAIATLPAGFRPSPSGPPYFRQASTNNQLVAVRLQLNVDGTIDMTTGSTAPATVDLSALSGFRAETT